MNDYLTDLFSDLDHLGRGNCHLCLYDKATGTQVSCLEPIVWNRQSQTVGGTNLDTNEELFVSICNYLVRIVPYSTH